MSLTTVLHDGKNSPKSKVIIYLLIYRLCLNRANLIVFKTLNCKYTSHTKLTIHCLPTSALVFLYLEKKKKKFRKVFLTKIKIWRIVQKISGEILLWLEMAVLASEFRSIHNSCSGSASHLILDPTTVLHAELCSLPTSASLYLTKGKKKNIQERIQI